MAGVEDGVYSVAVLGELGASLIVIKVQDGSIHGNDTAGASYVGSIHRHDPEHVKVLLEVTLPPNTFGVWGTSPTETHQTRSFNNIVPKSVFSGTPHELPGYGMKLMAVRVAEENGFLAEADGLQRYIELLQDVVASKSA
jgi:hypothetical protein